MDRRRRYVDEWDDGEAEPIGRTSGSGGLYRDEWDDDDEEEPEAASSDDEAPPLPEEELRHFCEGLYLTRKISARDLCTLMWWCSKCGVKGCDDLKYRPDAPSGHFQRKLNTALPYLQAQEKVLYELDIPGWDQDLGKKAVVPLLAIPPHEIMADLVEGDPSITVKLAERIEEQSLPECYFRHPIVLAAGSKPVIPISLFVDGVPYSQTDSVIGF